MNKYLKSITLKSIRIYKKFFSFALRLLLGDACRFTPTCSQYALKAIDKHGLIYGTNLSVKRVLRCNPWYKGKLVDPVP